LVGWLVGWLAVVAVVVAVASAWGSFPVQVHFLLAECVGRFYLVICKRLNGWGVGVGGVG
jgi:hypothetical protein